MFDQAPELDRGIDDVCQLAACLVFSALVVIWQQAGRHDGAEAAQVAEQLAVRHFGREVALDRCETWPVAA